jgi:acyl-CoA reductase-like NAD-dependent aldehyde dehydrogenase
MSERIQAGTVWVNTYRAVNYLSPFGGYNVRFSIQRRWSHWPKLPETP